MPAENYSTLLPTTGDTRRLLLGKILRVLLGGGGGGGGVNAQIVEYFTTDPNTDGVFPGNLNASAISYKSDGTGAMFGWDITAQMWK